MENMKIDRVAKRDAKDVMRFLKKHNPIFYNGINKDIRTWFLTYKYNKSNNNNWLVTTPQVTLLYLVSRYLPLKV